MQFGLVLAGLSRRRKMNLLPTELVEGFAGYTARILF